jgi:hypothetical protein
MADVGNEVSEQPPGGTVLMANIAYNSGFSVWGSKLASQKYDARVLAPSLRQAVRNKHT